MTLLEKIKFNLDSLLGKADSKSYFKSQKNSKMSLIDWQARWEIFSDNGCGFTWYGVDVEKNLAKFVCDEAYVPEALFIDVSNNIKLDSFFDNLPEITTAKLPEMLRPALQEAAERDKRNPLLNLWNPLKEAQRGIYIFSEANDTTWYKEGLNKQSTKNPYELLAMPDKSLKVYELSNEIQKLLEPYHFENLKFSDCRFLDVSKYIYCED